MFNRRQWGRAAAGLMLGVGQASVWAQAANPRLPAAAPPKLVDTRIVIALDPQGTILELVGFAWAGFGAAFGPLVLLSLFWRRLTNWGALSGMIVGAATVFIWDALGFELYEIIPGFIASLVVTVVVSLATFRSNAEVTEEFDDTVAMTASVPAVTAGQN